MTHDVVKGLERVEFFLSSSRILFQIASNQKNSSLTIFDSLTIFVIVCDKMS